LSSRCQWTGGICTRLKGILPIIQEALTSKSSDKEKMITLAEKIAETVENIFGNPLYIKAIVSDMKQKFG
jgi:hypothetical protein